MKGVSAVSLEEVENVNENILNGQYQLVFFSPESLILNRRWRKMLSSQPYEDKLKTIVFDEAHTIAKWYTVKKGGVTVTPFIGVKHLCKNGTSCGVKIDTILWCPGLTLLKVLHNDTTKWCQ